MIGHILHTAFEAVYDTAAPDRRDEEERMSSTPGSNEEREFRDSINTMLLEKKRMIGVNPLLSPFFLN